MFAPKPAAQEKLGWGGITFRTPVKVGTRVFDPRTNRPVRLRIDFLSWLRRHPHLRVTAPRAITIGGVPARELSGRVLSPDHQAFEKGYCGLTLSAGPCVPITADPTEEGYVSYELSQREVFRIVVFSRPGRGLLAHVSSWNPSGKPRAGRESAMLNRASAIIRTLRFG